jgi:antitoxin component of RelBE/YafQ-DinJ toxin-antitoxin module
MTTKSFQVRVSEDLLQRLNQESNRRGLKPTELVRLLISEVCIRDGEAREVVDAR